MSDPFEYLDEAEEVGRGGIGWLPLSLAGLAMAGFLAVPTLGFLKRKNKDDDWSKYVAAEDSVSVPADSLDSFEPLLTPNPEDLQQDLKSVDETLGNLGFAFTEPVDVAPVEVPPLREEAIKPSPAPVAKTPARPTGPHFNWTVKKGETLYRIGRKSGTTPRMIASLNGLEIDALIVPGQVLKIPGHRPVKIKPLVVSSKSTYPDAATPFRENVAQVAPASKDPVARKRPPGKTSQQAAAEPFAQEPKARTRPKPIVARPRPVNQPEAQALPRNNRPLQNEPSAVPRVNQFPR